MIIHFNFIGSAGQPLDRANCRTPKGGYVYLYPVGSVLSGQCDVSSDPISASFTTGSASFVNPVYRVYDADFFTDYGNTRRHYNFTSASGNVNATDYEVSSTKNTGITTASFALMARSASYAFNAANNSVSIGNTLIVDKVNGVPTGSSAIPFNNLTQAKNYATAGTTIFVYPGTYTENNLAKNGVNWFFHDGAILNYTSSLQGSGSFSMSLGLFDDRTTGPVTYSIGGAGQFLFNSQDSTASLGTFVSTNSSSFVTWKGKSIGYAHFPGSEAALGSRAALHGKHGTIFADFDTIYDAGLNQTLLTGFDDLDSPILNSPNATGIYWELGDMFVRFRYMPKCSGYLIWGNQPNGNLLPYNLYYEADLIDGAGNAAPGTAGQSTIYFDAPSPGAGNGGTYNWKTWGQVREVRNTLINIFQIGRHYLTAEKIQSSGTSTSTFSVPLGSQVWITAQKITGPLPWISVNDQSQVFVECQQFETTGSGGALGAFVLLNTSSYLDVSGHIAVISGSATPMVRSLGQAVFRNLTMDCSQNSSHGIVVDGTGLELMNCRLSSSLSGSAISASVPVSILAHGFSTNRPVTSNVTVKGQPIYFDGTGSAVSASNLYISYPGIVTLDSQTNDTPWTINVTTGDMHFSNPNGANMYLTNDGQLNGASVVVPGTDGLEIATHSLLRPSTLAVFSNADGHGLVSFRTALTSSYQITSSWSQTASVALTALNAGGSNLITGSLVPITSSYALTASFVSGSQITGSHFGTSSWAVSGGTQLATGSTVPITASWAINANSGSVITSSANVTMFIDFSNTGSGLSPTLANLNLTYNPATGSLFSTIFSGSQFTGSHFGTSSYATTASFVNNNSKVGFCLPIITVPSNNLAANTTYHFGADTITAANTGYVSASIDVPQSGVIKAFYIKGRVTTTGTSEPVTHSIFINNATAVGLPFAIYTSSVVDIRSTTLSASVNQGDTLTFRLQTPATYVTPPQTVRWCGYVYIE